MHDQHMLPSVLQQCEMLAKLPTYTNGRARMGLVSFQFTLTLWPLDLQSW